MLGFRVGDPALVFSLPEHPHALIVGGPAYRVLDRGFEESI